MAMPAAPAAVFASHGPEEDIVVVGESGEVTTEEIEEMVQLFVTAKFAHPKEGSAFNACLLRSIQDRCTHLFRLDYMVTVVSNKDGKLCPNYPLDIVILEREKTPEEKAKKMAKKMQEHRKEDGAAVVVEKEEEERVDGDEDEPRSPDERGEPRAEEGDDEEVKANSAEHLERLFEQCKFARTRCRFAVPVILLGKQVCVCVCVCV